MRERLPILFLVLSSLMGPRTFISTTTGYPEANSPVRRTESGPVQGYLHRLKSGELVERYLGVPYAKPPIGDLRFRKPIRPDCWKEVLQTTILPTACIQQRLDNSYIHRIQPSFHGQMSEDCLYLNIYVPHNTIRNMTLIPVLIHVHGGNNVAGTGGMYHGDVLASLGNMIVVTFNYRLGPFGFLSMPFLGIKGNYGIYDQQLAFKWVKTNIAFFGGDPGRVTVQGHSAGSIDLGFHILSPMAKGLFRAAILMSGSPTSAWGLAVDRDQKTALERHMENLRMLHCDGRNEKETLECLYQLPYTTFAKTFFIYPEKNLIFAPVVDNEYVLGPADNVLGRMVTKKGRVASCDDILIGLTRDEGSVYAARTLDQLKEPNVFRESYWENLPSTLLPHLAHVKKLASDLYNQNGSTPTSWKIEISNFIGDVAMVAPITKMADQMSKLENSSVYMYSFNHRSQHATTPDWMGVVHGSDQFYFFGIPIEEQEHRNYTNRDVEVSQRVIQLWSNFVHDPKKVSIPDEGWQFPKYTEKNKDYLVISGDNLSGSFFEVKQSLRETYVRFWNVHIPELEARLKNTQLKREYQMTGERGENLVYWMVTATICIVATFLSVILYGLLRPKEKKRLALLSIHGRSLHAWIPPQHDAYSFTRDRTIEEDIMCRNKRESTID